MEYHQLVLPQRYHRKVLNAYGSFERTLDLLTGLLAIHGQGCSKLGYVVRCFGAESAQTKSVI